MQIENSEVESLRDENERLSTQGGEITDAYELEKERNEELRYQIAELQRAPSRTEPRDNRWPDMFLLRPKTLTWFLVLLVFSEWILLRKWEMHEGAAADWQLTCVTVRSVTQAVFIIWSLAVWKTRGVIGLCEGLFVWAFGWFEAIFQIAHRYPRTDERTYLLLKELMFSNWWGQLYLSNRVRDILIGLFCLVCTAEMTNKFRLWSWCYRKAIGALHAR